MNARTEQDPGTTSETGTEEITWMWKTDTSGGGECPALLRAEGGYLVVGMKVDDPTRARVAELAARHDSGIGAGEDVLFLPADVINRIRG